MKGFTLLELAISITITGIVLAGALSVHKAQLMKEKLHVTKANQEEIEMAMRAFVNWSGRLPCPADPTIPDTVPSHGNEVDCGVGAFPPSGVVSTGGSVSGSNEIWIGAVPGNALQMSNSKTVDGYGNRFTYAVSRANSIRNDIPPSLGAIIIINATGAIVEPTAQYVIISHGANGSGAYTTMGVRRPCSLPEVFGNEREDCNNDNIFVSDFAQKNYDDITLSSRISPRRPPPPVCMGDKISPQWNVSIGKWVCPLPELHAR